MWAYFVSLQLCLNAKLNSSNSAGKSFVAEILMLRRVLNFGKMALLVLPYVSICAEKVIIYKFTYNPFLSPPPFLIPIPPLYICLFRFVDFMLSEIVTNFESLPDWCRQNIWRFFSNHSVSMFVAIMEIKVVERFLKIHL